MQLSLKLASILTLTASALMTVKGSAWAESFGGYSSRNTRDLAAEREARRTGSYKGIQDALNSNAYNRGFSAVTQAGEDAALIHSRIRDNDRGYNDYIDWQESQSFENEVEFQQKRFSPIDIASEDDNTIFNEISNEFTNELTDELFDELGALAETNHSYRYPREYDYYPRTRSDDIYSEAYEMAKARKMRELYDQGYKAGFVLRYREIRKNQTETEYEGGRNRAESEIHQYPIRLLHADVESRLLRSEYHAGDILEFHLKLINLSKESLKGQDLLLELQLLTADGAEILSARETLAGEITAESFIGVRDAFGLRIQASETNFLYLVIKARYKGREIGTQTLKLPRN